MELALHVIFLLASSVENTQHDFLTIDFNTENTNCMTLFSSHQQPNSYTKFWAMRTVGGNSSKSRPLFSASALQTRLVLPTLSPTNTTFLLILGRKYYSVRSSHNNNIASILLLSTRNYQRNAALCRTLDF